MRSLKGLLDLYKTDRQITTDIALANALGISRTALANYKAGARKLPDIAIVRIAEVTGVPVLNVMALANLALTELTEHEREFWLDYIE